jgi:hypothetical protein
MAQYAVCRYSALIFLALSSQAHAAWQGRLGASSTGSARISISKPVQAHISGLDDIVVAKGPIGSALVRDFCVYSTTGNYRITATGSGEHGAFTVGSGVHALPYAVALGSVGGHGAALSPNAWALTLSHASTSSDECGKNAARTARITVQLLPDGHIGDRHSYTGTLTMLIAPY